MPPVGAGADRLQSLAGATDRQRRLHLADIKKDITYFNKSYVRASLRLDLDGAGVEESVEKIVKLLLA